MSAVESGAGEIPAPVFKDARGRLFVPPTGADDPRLVAAVYALLPGGMVWRRLFPCRPDQVRRAREFVRCAMLDHPRVDDAVAAVSELANVAIARGGDRPFFASFIVEVQQYGRHGESSRVTVYDCGPSGIPTYRQRHSSVMARPEDTANDLALRVLHGVADEVRYWDAPFGERTYPMSAEFPTSDPQDSDF
ncbi:hypothetical protein SAMN05421505_12416 [Sinosporangium album]|uniref:Histidine kinase/HSP90-like ATPase domain-containing protein n=1 Tax=Sinosporangium album TaxID=504805 RepID=A0A1G8FNE7_9ACTN|nr:ATP-binding protein [Sinosporangium album]SDH83617.1 hypothetical protein SAMN05421505_12416 [Sinosporangium album]